MGVREYARHRGVSHTAVDKALKSGRIQKETDGTIDPTKADVAWNRNTDPAQQRKLDSPPAKLVAPTSKVQHQPTRKNDLPGLDSEPGPSGVAIPNYQVSRAIRETYNAKLARIDFEERMAKLVPKAQVLTAAFETGRHIRDGILSIPSRVAAGVAAVAPGTDVLAIERMLDKELRVVLEELNNHLKTIQ
ncbi:MAG: hypothetical protein HQL07_03945 [Nitrospirae bacterium]|nr:hypothetical protein [Magnetococcales bacterium]